MPTSKVRSGKRLPKISTPVPDGHGRRDGDDFVVVLGFFHQGIGENLGVGGGRSLHLDLLARDYVELVHGVALVSRRQRGREAFALLRDNMDENRPGSDRSSRSRARE